jgi:hypothetical protein
MGLGCRFVYNSELVRQLAQEISLEKDSQKSGELLALMQAVIREDVEEIRVRMAFLAKTLPVVADSESQAAD